MSTRTVSKIIITSAVLLLLGAGCLGDSGPAAPDGGVLKSSDGTENWHAINAVPTVKGVTTLATTNILNVQGDPSDSATVYVSTVDQGVFVTNDAGGEWRRLGTIGQRTVRMVAIDPVEPCTLYAASGNKILKSRDCGRAWQSVYETAKGEQEVRVVTIAPDNRALVYAGLNDGVYLVSQNGGGSWAVVSRFDALIRRIVIDPKNPARVYLVTEKNGVWRSDDRGAHFTSQKQTLLDFPGALRGWDLVLDPGAGNTLLYASTFGLLKSADGGLTWTALPLLTAAGEARIYSVVINPENSQEIYYSAVLGGKPLLYKTSDGGAHWKTRKLPSTRIPASIFIRQDKPQEVFLGLYQVPQQ